MSKPYPVPSQILDFTSKIREIVNEFDCLRHNAPVGTPCFDVRMGARRGHYAGICNVRATKRFNGVSNKKIHKEKR